MTEKLIDGEVSIKTTEAAEGVVFLGAKVDATAKKVTDLEKAAAKATELFAKGIGGGEAAEKIKSIGEGFKIAGDKAVDMADRVRAGAGAIGILGRMAVSTAGEIVRFAQEVVEATARLDEHQRQIDALGQSYNSAMSVAEQFAIRQQALRENIFLTAEQTTQLNESMRAFAITHGGNAAEAAQRFQQAVQSADNGALAQFGVHLDATIPASRRMAEALRQLANEQSTNPALPRTATENAAAWTAEMNHARDSITSLFDPMAEETALAHANARALTNSARIRAEERQQMLAQQTQLEALDTAIKNVTRTIQNEQNTAMTNASNLLASITNQIITYTTQLDRASNASQRFAFSADMGAEQNASRVQGARQMLANRRMQRDSDRTVAHELRAGGASHADLVALGLEQAGGARQSIEQLKQSTAAAIAEIQRLGGTWDTIQRRRGETEAHFWHRYEEHAQGALEHARQELEITRSIEEHHRALLQVLRDEKALKDEDVTTSKEGIAGRQDAAASRGTFYARSNSGSEYGADNEQLQAMQQASDYSTQFAQTFQSNTELMGTSAQNMASIAGNAFSGLTNSFKGHLAAVIEQRESFGDAVQGMLHETLLSVATEATVQAIFESGKAIASAAAYDYVGASQHAAAAGMFAATALVTGVGAYVTTPGKGASAGGGFSSAGKSSGTGPSPNSGSGGGDVYNFNVNGFAATEVGVQDAIGRAVEAKLARGSLRGIQRPTLR